MVPGRISERSSPDVQPSVAKRIGKEWPGFTIVHIIAAIIASSKIDALPIVELSLKWLQTLMSEKEHEILEELLVLVEIADSVVLKTRLSRLLLRYGIDCWLVTNLQPQTRAGWQSGILMNAWPDAWYQRYLDAGLYRHDPCVARSLASRRPFAWDELASEIAPNTACSRTMAEAREFGLRQGFCVPLHLPGARSAVVTMAGEVLDDAPGTARILRLAAIGAFWSFTRHQEPAPDRDRAQHSDLTLRECEVLQWTAAGKTAWEVGRILGIAETTAIAHLRNARTKLGAANVVHAVTEALRLKHIQL